ncbi:MAG: hypothetical protein Q4D59_09035 [Erysipelotrichaceae bacterium]|nr:hypothetical protein [Erysipelotrichaceae bacterium]
MRISNYDKYPETVIRTASVSAYENRDEIAEVFVRMRRQENHVLAVECYPGTDDEVRDFL